MTAPRFIHDCEACVFLGQHVGQDLYFCPAEPTLIARRSSDGPDYVSGESLADRIPALAEARYRAQRRGLYS